MEPFPSALLTDLYQLTMIQAYLECRNRRIRILRPQAAGATQLSDGGRLGAGARFARESALLE